MKRILVLFILIIVHLRLVAQQSIDIAELKNTLFNDTIVQEFYISISSDTLTWLFDENNLLSDYEFKAQLVVKNGSKIDTVPDIGFRLRGNTSRFSQKKSFKIDINSYVKGRRFYGLKDLNLNGEHNDPSIMRAELSWDLLNKLGVASSRASHAKVYINNQFYGLYLSVEDIDDEFVLERFGNDTGNLYKCLWPADLTWLGESPDAYKFSSGGRRAYELKTNEDSDDYTGLRDFIQFLQFSNDNDFSNQIEDHLDVDGVLRWLTVDILTGNWDNYWHNKNNYYLYHDFSTNLFHFIPYDYDNTFGIAWDNTGWADQSPDNWTPTKESRKLVTRILNIPEYKNRLHFYLSEMLATYYTAETLESKWNTVKSLVQQAAEEDYYRTLDYGYSIQDFNRSFVESTGNHDKYGIKPFVLERISSLENGQIQLNPIPIWVTAITENYLELDPTKVRNTQNLTPFLNVILNLKDDKSILNSHIVWHYRYDEQTEWREQTDTVEQREGQKENEGFASFSTSLTHSIEYYVEISDSDGNKSRFPKNPESTLIYTLRNSNGLILNEFMASNTNTIFDENEEFEDWVELYNNSENPVNLQSFSLTDNLSEPEKFALPDSVIQPFSHVLIWLDDDTEQGALHANFKLSKSGEFIGLYSNDLAQFVDSLSFGAQEDDISFARITDAYPIWQLVKPTPGTANVYTNSIDDEETFNPIKIQIASIFPNPFNPTTTIRFSLSKPGSVSLSVFDVVGRKVAELEKNTAFSTGTHQIQWNASGFASGIYIIQLQSENFSDFKKVTLIK